MKRTLIAAALLVSFPLCYAQTRSGGAAPITGAQTPPGMPSNPIGNSSITSPIPGSTPNSPSSAAPGSSIGSVGTGPSSSGSSVGSTIQGQPLPSAGGPVSPPSPPSNLRGTGTTPGALGRSPPAPRRQRTTRGDPGVPPGVPASPPASPGVTGSPPPPGP